MLGGVTFFELMDRFGVVQCVSEELLDLHKHDVVHVKGTVQLKPEDAKRSDKDPIEIHVLSLEALNKTAPLPLSTDEGKAHEQTRLKYRYLDLRRPEMWRRLTLKSKVYQFTRQFFADRDFLEVETPVLYKSTPEGARDYLVPSRLYKGQFYALPQSPQMLKQLLMISGVDRYMQIVRCFRDEDLRQNRQPEFTQLDLECAFVDEAEIMSLMGQYVSALFEKFECPLAGISQLTFNEAMAQYGSDCPDLRYQSLKFHSIRDACKTVDFPPFQNVMSSPDGDVTSLCLKGTPPSRSVLSKIEQAVKDLGAGGLIWVVREGEALKSNAKKVMTPEIIEAMAIECPDFNLGFVLAGDKQRYAWMDGLRRCVIEHLRCEPESEYAACWVTDFPLFGEASDGGIMPMHHPFTSPCVSTLQAFDEGASSSLGLLNLSARAYDIVINGQEVGGGSIRIHEAALQRRIFEMLGLSAEEIEEKFGFFLEALSYGAPPHGGIALGMDRLVCVMDGNDAIRDYIAFPKTQNAQCLMSGAPSSVPEAQMKELFE